MNVDALLRSSARDVLEGVVPPPPDIGSARQQARRERAGRRWKHTAVAAVVTAGAVLALPSLDPDPRPATPPAGPAPVLTLGGSVWADEDGIHLGSRVLDPGSAGAVRWLTLVDGGVVYAGHEGGLWFQSRDGGRRLLASDAPDEAVGDVNGSAVAWFEGGDLVVVDTSTGRETVRTTVPRDVPAQAAVTFVNTMQVYYGTVTDPWVYHRLTDRHSPRAATIVDTTSRMLVVLDSPEGPGAQLRSGVDVTFTNNSGWTIGAYGPVIGRGWLSPSGLFYATLVPGAGGGQVVAVDTYTSHGDRLTRSRSAKEIGWGYGDTLMVEILAPDGTTARLLACDASEDACQRLPHQGDVVLPRS